MYVRKNTYVSVAVHFETKIILYFAASKLRHKYSRNLSK